MMNFKLATLLSLLAAFLAQSAFADSGYWEWKDANGVTNFSQQKPKDHAAKHVIGNGPYGYKETLEDSRRPGMAPPPKKAEAPKPAMADKKPGSNVNPDQLIAAQKAKMQQKVAAARQKNCTQARRNLKALQRPRVRTTGKDGKVYVMSPKRQQSLMDDAQKAIDENCGG